MRKSSWKGSIGISSYSCEGTNSIRNTSTNYRSCKRSRNRDLMHRCRLLLGSKISSSSSSKSSIELSLGSSNICSVLNREGGGSSHQGDNHQFIHVVLLSCSRESSE